MFPFISIIIAVKKNNHYLQECIEHCLGLDYPLFEIIILPDEMMAGFGDNRIKIIATGAILPAAKRDIGADNARGDILAFIDDDAYPDKNWLKQASTHFNDGSIACVCGPGITPPMEPLLQRASANVYESWIVSGPARYRYIPQKQRTTDDFPSCNFFIRKNIFQQLGGFKTKFWPGEDTILCLEVAHTLKKKIIYDPLVVTYHHRRALYKSHLKQVANYALHRGYFIKRYPRTSFRFSYFCPTLIILFVLYSVIAGFLIHRFFFLAAISYFVIVLLFSFSKNIRLTIYVFAGIVATHFTYGAYFIKGLASKKLIEE